MICSRIDTLGEVGLPAQLCPKCKGTLTEEELTMYGKYGFGGKAYRFKGMICPLCGFTELYFRGQSMLL